jgi:MFS family permease
MIAVISSAWVLPGLVGPALAGWISEELSWRWTFIGLVPLLPLAALAVGSPLARLSAPDTAMGAGSRKVNGSTAAGSVRDAAQLAIGAGALLTAASFGDPLPRLAAAVAGVLLVVPALRRLLPPGALTASTPRGAAVATLALVSVAFFGTEAFIPLAVASVRNAGTVAGGLALTAAAVTWAAGSWIQARLAPRRSRRAVTLAGLGLVAAGVAFVAAVPLTSLHPVAVAATAWAVAGLGMGLAYSTATLAIIESAETGEEGAASASVQLANTLGIALGTGVAGGVVALSARGALGMAPGIVLANAVMLIALVAALYAGQRMSATTGAVTEA